ncbi:MAG: dockerin type I repeat-containing protein, partial [Candidatus Roizmanbacteria bacterium]
PTAVPPTATPNPLTPTVTPNPLTPTPTSAVPCAYPNLAIEVSADTISWGSGAETVRSANGYTKRFYRIKSNSVSIDKAKDTTSPITIKWEKTASTGGGVPGVVSTYTTTATNLSLSHAANCNWTDTDGGYFACGTVTTNRAQNIGDGGDYKFTVSSPACTNATATVKITPAIQALCPIQGVRLEYSADQVNWRRYGQYFQSNPPAKMCARVVDTSTGSALDMDYLEERWWTPELTAAPSDTNATSIGTTNALTGGWVPWKNGGTRFDTGCWTPSAPLATGIWTGEARYYGLAACTSTAKMALGAEPTCSANNPPIFKAFGDANGDCEIDIIHDFVQFIREKTSILTTKLADFNGDGAVDGKDFAIWKSGYQNFLFR